MSQPSQQTVVVSLDINELVEFSRQACVCRLQLALAQAEGVERTSVNRH